MPVVQVHEQLKLEVNKVYVIPPNRRLLISDRDVGTYPFEEARGQRHPIDQFFNSLADQHGDGVAIIMSGAGADGSLGIKAIKEAGGVILVQDPQEAEYSSMPQSAVQTGLADVVAPVRELARTLVELVKAKQRVPDLAGDDDEENIRRILSHLRGRTGHDFTHYKRPTVLRRIVRRMQINNVDRLSDYYALLCANPEEAQSLFTDLLISVTHFFRDARSFESLTKLAIAPLFEKVRASDTLRIWVAGCATGEEAYSIAMLFMEEAERHETPPFFHIFASDLDAKALAIAREGRYPAAIEADASAERLNRFFVKEGDYYRVKRGVRDAIVFTNHSLLKEPPFSKLDLISCRNLLIYLDRELQQQVCATFHYALNPGGYLFLGSSETADSSHGDFHVLNRDMRIYQSPQLSHGQRHVPRLALSPHAFTAPEPGHPPQTLADKAASVHLRALEAMAPPSILVDRTYRVVHLSETAGRFLQPSKGSLATDITQLVRPELRFDLRTGLHNALEKKSSELSLPIPLVLDGARKRVYMQVWPVMSGEHDPQQAVVLFIEGAAISPESDEGPRRQDSQFSAQVMSLQEELELTRARLRTSREEFEGANEELRAANEELQSINEEYRSTAEELETSKEELQSINEELQTVNSELKVKLDAVSRANNDVQNLISATDVGTLFLDSQLRIKLFTPSLGKLFNITQNDELRLITDFTHRLDYPAFAEDARAVIKEQTPIEREIASGDSWFLARLRPYTTADLRTDGIVVSFIDITNRLKTERELKASEARSRLLLQELSHRVKNTIAVVQSIARQSFKGDAPLADKLDSFMGRLGALASAHEVLVQSDWSGAELHDLIEKQLSAHFDGNKARIDVSGPKANLPPELATPFALALHELGTNAIKHGAFSQQDGTLSLHWGLDQHGVLTLIWQERGPATVTPSHSGFGTYLIERGVPGSEVHQSSAWAASAVWQF